jgi:hypothetical protein
MTVFEAGIKTLAGILFHGTLVIAIIAMHCQKIFHIKNYKQNGNFTQLS